MQPVAGQGTLPVMSTDFATDDLRYEAVRSRDGRAEGRFVYAVVTTGVYCRPTCAARLALRRNVRFHDTPEAAERAGFRACLRCRPRQSSPQARDLALVAEARAWLETAEGPVTLEMLAARAGLSPHHFHRLFKRHAGLTPQAYAAAARLRRFGAAVRDGGTVTEALHQAGYGSSSRFYEADSGALGVPPAALRAGAPPLHLRITVRPSSLGPTLIAATGRGVCAILFGEGRGELEAELRRRFPCATLEAGDPALAPLADAVVALIDSAGVGPDVPLDLIGTAFQQRVWRALREIPRGTTIDYGELARRIGSPRAVRAVGTACGANPLAVAVPCHRVLRADGGLGGYRWGLPRKQALLARERKK